MKGSSLGASFGLNIGSKDGTPLGLSVGEVEGDTAGTEDAHHLAPHLGSRKVLKMARNLNLHLVMSKALLPVQNFAPGRNIC